MGNNESSGVSGLLALWGPLILIGALIFVFQVDRKATENAEEIQTAGPATAPESRHQTVIAKPLDPPKGIESAPVAATEVTAAADAPHSLDRQTVEGTTATPPEKAPAAALPPEANVPTPTAARATTATAPQVATASAASTQPAVAYILAYPPVSGPYRLSAGWHAPPPYAPPQPPLLSHPWRTPDANAPSSPYAAQWAPCAPPYYWCRTPGQAYFKP